MAAGQDDAAAPCWPLQRSLARKCYIWNLDAPTYWPHVTSENCNVSCLAHDLGLPLANNTQCNWTQHPSHLLGRCQHTAHLLASHVGAVKEQIRGIILPVRWPIVEDDGERDIIPPEDGEEGEHARHSLRDRDRHRCGNVRLPTAHNQAKVLQGSTGEGYSSAVLSSCQSRMPPNQLQCK